MWYIKNHININILKKYHDSKNKAINRLNLKISLQIFK
jgi:hypothetical protein